MIDRELVDVVLTGAWQRDSPWHGEEHWRCVTASGLMLAGEDSSADRVVVFCFGLLHDTRRENEHYDPVHGPRAAAYLRDLATTGALTLTARQLALLCEAIERHSDGAVSEEPTIAACWDADRLHLPRVGIDPRKDLFSTTAARGPGPLAAAARLRGAPPTWDELLSVV